jgi:hypothetical protein
MSIVPISEAYVDANFKEVQLTKVRDGQTVTLTSDLYGSDVTYKGRVVGLSGGTGSSFALIPTQNATGNWIKVVQRVPVRIALDRTDLQTHPLRVGLSMTAGFRPVWALSCCFACFRALPADRCCRCRRRCSCTSSRRNSNPPRSACGP